VGQSKLVPVCRGRQPLQLRPANVNSGGSKSRGAKLRAAEQVSYPTLQTIVTDGSGENVHGANGEPHCSLLLWHLGDRDR